MKQELQPRTAIGSKPSFTLITGASKGIGKEFALECARRGHHLALVSLAGEGLPELSAEISQNHRIQVVWKELDLGRPEAPQEIYDWTQDLGLKVQVLINNAGYGSLGGFHSYTSDFYIQMVNVNVQATLGLTTLFLPQMKEQERAYILNMSSAGGLFPVPQKVVYSASKAFVYYMSRSLRHELRRTGVKVTVMCPNGVPTNDTLRARVQQLGWLGKMASVDPDEVAKIGLDSMYRGKAVVVPGWFNRFSLFISKVIGTNATMSFMEKQFLKEMPSQESVSSNETPSPHLN